MYIDVRLSSISEVFPKAENSVFFILMAKTLTPKLNPEHTMQPAEIITGKRWAKQPFELL